MKDILLGGILFVCISLIGLIFFNLVEFVWKKGIIPIQPHVFMVVVSRGNIFSVVEVKPFYGPVCLARKSAKAYLEASGWSEISGTDHYSHSGLSHLFAGVSLSIFAREKIEREEKFQRISKIISSV